MRRPAPRFVTAAALLTAAAPAAAEERSFMFSGFERVRVDGPFEVIVERAPSPGVVAAGDVAALDRLSVRIDGRTLVIAQGVNGWGGYPGAARTLPVVRVRTPSLRAATAIGAARLTIDRLDGQRVDVALSGAADMRVADVRADRLEAVVVGVGSLRIAGQAISARFVSNGSGTIEAADLRANALSVTAQGSGEGRYAARDTAQVTADGQGRIDVAGSPACTVHGTAPVTCGTRR